MSAWDGRQRVLAGLLVVFVVGVGGWQLLKWWNRPTAVEFDNLKYVQLLTTAVSSRSPEMVAKVDVEITKRFDHGKMSQAEYQHFQKLVALGRAEKWEEAIRGCFEFAEAQLGRSRSQAATESHDHDHRHHHEPDADHGHAMGD